MRVMHLCLRSESEFKSIQTVVHVIALRTTLFLSYPDWKSTNFSARRIIFPIPKMERKNPFEKQFEGIKCSSRKRERREGSRNWYQMPTKTKLKLLVIRNVKLFSNVSRLQLHYIILSEQILNKKIYCTKIFIQQRLYNRKT